MARDDDEDNTVGASASPACTVFLHTSSIALLWVRIDFQSPRQSAVTSIPFK